jgi:polyphosphate kinase
MKVKDNTSKEIEINSPEAYINRELSWLSFARRVLAMAQDPKLPLLERVKFAGIMGMLYDEFAMKRMGGLKRKIKKKKIKPSRDGLTPDEQLRACRTELKAQAVLVSRLVQKKLRPALAEAGIPILEYKTLNKKQRMEMLAYFQKSVEPILTPLAVDVSHPFPFISNLGLNLAIKVTEKSKKRNRFVRIKVPTNRPRWVPLSGKGGFVPLEQVISANLKQLFPQAVKITIYCFRVARVAKDDPWEQANLGQLDVTSPPGYFISMVTNELKARKFAGVVRLEVSAGMPKVLRSWLAEQLEADKDDIESVRGLLALADLMLFPMKNYPDLCDPPHTPVTHPRLSDINASDPDQIFDEIRRADIMLHHPYHSFDTSVLNFLQCAALDPKVLAIKLTIYRTSRESPIIQALQLATLNNKQVAVLVEITARFDEAPNIEWGQHLERAGVHVAYGVERLKTHVKLALVVREEKDGIRRYVHVGTGNYHTGTARIYEDLGILSCDPELGTDVAALFNELTSANHHLHYHKLMVAPHNLRERITGLIRREAENKRKGKSCGIIVKMNQLQDARIINELYRAGQAGVPIRLNIRGLCCLRAGVPGLSENIRVFCTLGRFLEHSRVYCFENAGDPEYFIGSADWMRRNLDRRMESVIPVTDPKIKKALLQTLQVYEEDNHSAWDMLPDGSYKRRRPKKGESPRPAQEALIDIIGR